eukprot:Awhi_evm1s5370
MKVPEDKKSMGIYKSPESYIDTLYRLWLAVTFNDGHNALTPKCSAITNSSRNTPCGSTLKSRQNFKGKQCRNRNCSGMQPDHIFSCDDEKHHFHLCPSCFSKRQSQLLGSAQQNGSNK